MDRPNTRKPRLKSALLTCAFGLAAVATGAQAQTQPGTQLDSRALLELMVDKGLVTRAEADVLIAKATVPVPVQQAAVPPGGIQGDTQTIPYIPQTVRNQLKEELRTELANQAATEGWARPGEMPEWTKRITLFGDIRVRGEGIFQDKGNFDLSYVNYQAINAGAGYDISRANPVNAPFLNTTENRQRARIRARLGIHAQIDDWISGELRVATGSDRSPVSTNQTLGGNGEFGKYAIWLDRANIRLTPVKGADIVFGRFANPFWSSELIFDEDINFDGVAASGRYALNDQFSVFGTAGAFPIFNSEFNFGSNNSGAYSSHDKYLFAGQIGAEFKPTEKLSVTLAGGYFDFDKVQGRTSSPCQYYEITCDTDDTRPQFVQLGNSLFPLRNIIPNPAIPNPLDSPEVQYFGLASKFRVLNVHGQLEYRGFGNGLGVRLEGDFVKNLAFNRSLVAGRAVNNLGPDITVSDPNDSTKTIRVAGPWAGGDTGWYAQLLVGRPVLSAPGDWQVFGGYRHIESDATLDAFNDSDFHNLGGTNVKGWHLGGAYAFGKNTSIGARYLSADTITGVPLSTDVLQIDLTTRF